MTSAKTPAMTITITITTTIIMTITTTQMTTSAATITTTAAQFAHLYHQGKSSEVLTGTFCSMSTWGIFSME